MWMTLLCHGGRFGTFAVTVMTKCDGSSLRQLNSSFPLLSLAIVLTSKLKNWNSNSQLECFLGSLLFVWDIEIRWWQKKLQFWNFLRDLELFCVQSDLFWGQFDLFWGQTELRRSLRVRLCPSSLESVTLKRHSRKKKKNVFTKNLLLICFEFLVQYANIC